jgi:hypothetical protein
VLSVGSAAVVTVRLVTVPLVTVPLVSGVPGGSKLGSCGEPEVGIVRTAPPTVTCMRFDGGSIVGILVRGLCGDRVGSGPEIGLAGPEDIGPTAIGFTVAAGPCEVVAVAAF